MPRAGKRGWIVAGGMAVVLGAGIAGCGGSGAAKSANARPTTSVGAPTTSVGAASGSAHPLPPPAPLPGPGATTSRGGTLGQAVSPGQPDIVRTGDVALRVAKGSIRPVFDRITGLATGNGGYVADSNMDISAATPSAQLTLRVRNADLDAVVADLGSLGTITSEHLQGSDVTGQVIDLNAQITNLQSEEGAVRTLLDRAQAIGDILTIQNQLFDLQGQIQELTGQSDTLSNQVALATLSVELTLTEGVVPTRPPAPHHNRSAISRAWSLAVDHTLAAVRGIALAVGWAAPLLVVAAAVGVPLLIRWRRRRRSGPGPHGPDSAMPLGPQPAGTEAP